MAGAGRPAQGRGTGSGFAAAWFAGLGVAGLVQAVAAWLGDWPAFDGRFAGPDAYMRLVRILECGNGGCPGGLLTRSNAPFGEVLHWPHLVDGLIVAIATPLRVGMPWSDAVATAGYLAGPVLESLALVAVLVAARTLVDRPAWMFAGVFLASQLWVSWAFAPGRPDHHGMQALFFLVAIAAVSRLLVGPPSRGAEVALGLAVGGALWVSVEGLVTVTLPLIALGLRWAWTGGREGAASVGRIHVWAGLLLLAGVLVDGPEAGRWVVVYDRLSVVHVALLAAGAGIWALLARGPGLASVRGRLGALAIGGAGAALVLTRAFPGLPRGPLTDVDARIVPIWLDQVAEYVPFLHRATPGALLEALLPVVLALPITLVATVRSREGHRWAWGLLSGCLVWFSVLGLVHGSRWSYYVHPLIPLAWCGLLEAVFRRGGRLRHALPRAALNVGAVAGLLVGPLVLVAAASAPASSDGTTPLEGCAAEPLARMLADRTEPGGIILAPVFWGPEILYRTELDVVATPYHRNHEGILASRDIMRAADDAEIRGRLQARGIRYIALCRAGAWLPLLEGPTEGSLHRRLVTGNAPDFLEPVELSGPDAGRYGVWRVELEAGPRDASSGPVSDSPTTKRSSG